VLKVLECNFLSPAGTGQHGIVSIDVPIESADTPLSSQHSHFLQASKTLNFYSCCANISLLTMISIIYLIKTHLVAFGSDVSVLPGLWLTD